MPRIGLRVEKFLQFSFEVGSRDQRDLLRYLAGGRADGEEEQFARKAPAPARSNSKDRRCAASGLRTKAARSSRNSSGHADFPLAVEAAAVVPFFALDFVSTLHRRLLRRGLRLWPKLLRRQLEHLVAINRLFRRLQIVGIRPRIRSSRIGDRCDSRYRWCGRGGSLAGVGRSFGRFRRIVEIHERFVVRIGIGLPAPQDRPVRIVERLRIVGGIRRFSRRRCRRFRRCVFGADVGPLVEPGGGADVE